MRHEWRDSQRGLRIPATQGNGRNASESDLHGTPAAKQERSRRRSRSKQDHERRLNERRADRRNRQKTGEQRTEPATTLQERSAAHPGFRRSATHSNSTGRTCGDRQSTGGEPAARPTGSGGSAEAGHGQPETATRGRFPQPTLVGISAVPVIQSTREHRSYPRMFRPRQLRNSRVVSHQWPSGYSDSTGNSGRSAHSFHEPS